MRVNGRFEIQERDELRHLSVEGSIEYGNDVEREWQIGITDIEIHPSQHEKFTKLVLTALFNGENSFDFIFYDKGPNLPGLVRIWPEQLFEYFGIPKINETD